MSRKLTLVALGCLGGCGVDQSSTATIDQAVISPNGISPNGISPNGISPNGISPNGISPNGVSLNGISPNGISPNGAPLGVAGTGTPLNGPKIVGSTWTGHLSNGKDVAIRIDAAMQGSGANSDVWSYMLSVSADGTWRPLCLDADSNPIFADSVAGTWNLAQGVAGGGSYHPNTHDFTIACRGSAIAKCVELGYKPWNGFSPELATCVRALRGDYCGDGTPYTVTGTIVNIFDVAGVQADTESWVPEAAWTPEGAACISDARNTRFFQDAHEKPSCFPHALKQKKSCGTEFSDGELIITELPPQ